MKCKQSRKKGVATRRTLDESLLDECHGQALLYSTCLLPAACPSRRDVVCSRSTTLRY